MQEVPLVPERAGLRAAADACRVTGLADRTAATFALGGPLAAAITEFEPRRGQAEMADAVPEVQWTMNMALATIGIHFAKHRKRAIAIGEKLGIYRDYPCSKGCTSPFAPIWINAMVSRQG